MKIVSLSFDKNSKTFQFEFGKITVSKRIERTKNTIKFVVFFYVLPPVLIVSISKII